MRIVRAIFTAGASSYFFDDQKAIKGGVAHDGFLYTGKPVTQGFTSIRMPGECVSVLLMTDRGAVGVGDCAAVQYSGAGGRDPLFLSSMYIPFLEGTVRPFLESLNVDGFRAASEAIDRFTPEGKRLHTAIRYGVSQALLAAAAADRGMTPTETLLEEYGLPFVPERIPVFGQSGDDRYLSVDRMILKGVDALPHGLINNVDEKFGRDGAKLREYVAWIAGRIRKLRRDPSYVPAIHVDIYGTAGLAFDGNAERIVSYLASLESASGEFPLYVEGPVDMEEKGRQIETLLAISTGLDRNGSRVKIVADEWCNTIEDIREFADARCCHMIQIKTPDLGCVHNIVESVLYCNANGTESYQGGTCNETDVSARICVHLALAARPSRMLAKPGMGFDEGYAIVNNEMDRTLALLSARRGVDSGRKS